jgi:hypothetical protein
MKKKWAPGATGYNPREIGSEFPCRDVAPYTGGSPQLFRPNLSTVVILAIVLVIVLRMAMRLL